MTIRSHTPIWNDLAAYVFLLAAGVVLLFPVLAKEGSFCVHPDNLHQAYPFFCKLATSLHKGYLPIWDANTYGGKNLPGEFQAGIFYPLNIAWCLLFGSAAGIDVYYLDLLVALHYLICLLGMYRLGRVWRLSPAASVASALVFTFTGVLSARSGGQTCIFFGLTWIPWALYFSSKYYTHRAHKKYLVFAGLIGGVEILSGHIQPFFHSVVMSAVLVLFYEWRDRKDVKSFLLSVLTNMSILVLVSLLVALPQVYDSFQYMSDCYRWVGAENPIGPGQKVPFHIYAYKYIIRLSDLPNLLGRYYSEPDDGNILYMGILPLFLLIAWLTGMNRLTMRPEHVRLKKILLILFVGGILSVLGYVTCFCVLLYELPFVPSIRELGRYSICISTASALSVGLAITYLPELKERLFRNFRTIKWYGLLFLCLNALYLVLAERQHSFPPAVTIPFLLGFLFLFLWMNIRQTTLLPVLAIAFICIDLFMNRVDFSPTQSPFYPTRYYARNRIIDSLETTYGKYRVDFNFQNDDLLRRNIGDVYAIQTKMGYCATMNRPYFDFISRGWGSNASEVNDLLNIRYVVTDKVLDSNYVFKDSTGGLNLYERKSYYPRMYWKSQLGRPGPEIERENEGTIRPLAYSDEYQKIMVDCQTPDTLILSENFYPGWKCYDNGRRIPLFPAAIKQYPRLFRAVVLEKGRHLLEFKYNFITW